MSSSYSYPSFKLDIPTKDGRDPADYYLTPFRPDDVEALWEVLSMEAEVSDWLISIPKPYTREHAQFWVDLQIRTAQSLAAEATNTLEGRRARLFRRVSDPVQLPVQVIRHGTEEGRLVGCVSLTTTSALPGAREREPEVELENMVELGYYLHPAHRGLGIMTVAAKKALAFASAVYGVGSVYAMVDGENEASRRIVESLVEITGREGGARRRGGVVLRWPEGKVKTGERERESWWWWWEV